MKVAILTITNGANYGNRLQNYAVQKTLEKLGVNSETLINNSTRKLSNFRRFLSKTKKDICYLKQYRRNKEFQRFNLKHINYSKYIIDNEFSENKINEEYDFFVCGSDQIWNPNYLENAQANFLQFADFKKRIAFAPSFGVSEITESRKEEIKKWLKSIPSLSIREKAGAKIIKELVNQDVKVLVDPTLLLNKSDWLEIAETSHLRKDKRYILKYYLGIETKEYKNYVDRISKDKKIEIIDLKNEGFNTGPSEFIDLINNAELVCTDSFHGCVFSIIFRKPFIVFKRNGVENSMYSRIETLLNLLNLNEREYNKTKDTKTIFNISKYHYIDIILQEEKDKSINYLSNALGLYQSKEQQLES